MPFFAQPIHRLADSSNQVIAYALFEGGDIALDGDAHERFVGIISGYDPFDTNYDGIVDGAERLPDLPIFGGFFDIFSGVSGADLQATAFRELAFVTADSWFQTQANLQVVSLAADILENGSVAVLDAIVSNATGLVAGSLAANLASSTLGQVIIQAGAEQAFARLADLTFDDETYQTGRWIISEPDAPTANPTADRVYISNGSFVSGNLGDGDDVFIGSAASESLSFGGGINVGTFGDGNDTITGDDDGNAFDGGAGNDSITTGFGNDTLIGGDGDDTLAAGEGVDS
ncbi:calcium-binding protein, partial [Cognatishimia sp. F0-27]|uniref:calcium-binding protein n=1 Tax=Cognatishimia sp. F0-27 TaxID=2816855 RepID=UPI00351D0DDA